MVRKPISPGEINLYRPSHAALIRAGDYVRRAFSLMIYKMAGKKDPFARVPNAALADDRLSWKAKGILAYLCGKPDGWKMRVADLVRQSPDGKCAIRAALDELRAFGYAEYIQGREGGMFRDGEWKISDSPIFSPVTGFRDADNRHHSKKESSNKESLKKSKETASCEAEKKVSFSPPEFKAEWKPIEGTKADQLRFIKPPRDYPSEREYDDFLESSELDQIGMGKRGDLYSNLCNAKWHHWTGRRWRRIGDWRKYIAGLDSAMMRATRGE